ncbi:putative 2OG-Fe(II) oxygenase [Novosphingobium sp. NPDC080210]|uniref:putative 2OG-Fe(II) oxygenase n=1 Tax=Novosphingobium sp. NPDC080210 TaxID=3390596 RepID=UPI003D08CE70
MNPQQRQIAEQLAERARSRADLADPPRRAALLDVVRQALGQGLAAQALPLLSALSKARPADPEIALLHGVALRREQRLLDAAAVFSAAIAAGAKDPALVQGLAQTRYELGQPAAALFAEAQARNPADLEILRNRALALASEGGRAGAETLLEEAVTKHPAWLDGHKALSVLRWTGGDQARHAASYGPACAAQPGNADLWLAWFRALAQARDWTGARGVLDRAERSLGVTPAILVSRLFIASEAGEEAETERLLAATAALQGETINLIRVRHALRRGEPDAAEAVCLPQLITPSAPLFWPYITLAWRVKNDPRATWVDRPDQFIKACPVDLDTSELPELAALLRQLHTMEQPYIEQSVRGGTQTDRSVILRHEPIMQRARARWMEAIRRYVDDLPPWEQGHPLLGLPRQHLLIEGSWSVRLLRQGYNVPHNHPVGWLSTAFYIALPSPDAMGPAPAGHIAFGTPPEELGLDLQPYRTIAPQEGVTAVFPSTMWHRTMPFEDGERLVMALDVARPRY